MVIKIASSVPGHLLFPPLLLSSLLSPACTPPIPGCVPAGISHFACSIHKDAHTHTRIHVCRAGCGLLWRTHPSTSAAVVIVIIIVIIIVVLRSALEMGSARLNRLQQQQQQLQQWLLQLQVQLRQLQQLCTAP